MHSDDIFIPIIMISTVLLMLVLMIALVAPPTTSIENMELAPSKIVYETPKENNLLSKRVVLGYVKNNPSAIVVKLEQEETQVVDLGKKTGMKIEYEFIQGEVVQLSSPFTLEQINQVRNLKNKYIQLANDNIKIKKNQEQILDVILKKESEEPVQEEVEEISSESFE